LITAFWYDLGEEIQKYLKANSFSNSWVTLEPDLINESNIKPVIIIEWFGSTGGDIDDDDKRLDRDKIVTLNFFIETYNSTSDTNSGLTRKLQYNLQSLLLRDLHNWHNLEDDVDFPLSDVVNWGGIQNQFPATKMTNNDTVNRDGIGVTVNFHYSKGAIENG